MMEIKKPAWSHSALKDFEGCARRYHEVRVLRKHTFQESEAILYGNALHKAAELYVNDGTPIPEKFIFVKPTLDALLRKPGRKMAEQKMALRADLTPCDWFAKDVWVRGVADLLIIDDENLTARVVDYKTGNNKYPDRDQLVLMSAMVMVTHPHVRKVDSALLFVVKNDMVRMTMGREELDDAWWEFRERVAKLDASFANDVWNPKSSPLCGWCVVKSCEHNPKH